MCYWLLTQKPSHHLKNLVTAQFLLTKLRSTSLPTLSSSSTLYVNWIQQYSVWNAQCIHSVNKGGFGICYRRHK